MWVECDSTNIPGGPESDFEKKVFLVDFGSSWASGELGIPLGIVPRVVRTSLDGPGTIFFLKFWGLGLGTCSGRECGFLRSGNLWRSRMRFFEVREPVAVENSFF